MMVVWTSLCLLGFLFNSVQTNQMSSDLFTLALVPGTLA